MKGKVGIFLIALLIFSPPLQAKNINFLEKKAVKLGEAVPNFELKDTAGAVHQLSDSQGKVVMIHFWSAECPFVVRYDEQLKALTDEFSKQGVTVLAIDANGNEKLEEIKKVAEDRKVNYPVLIDPDHKVADQFGAITTPHVFIVDAQGKLAYEGAVDDQGWSADKEPKQFYVRDALTQVLAGQPVTTAQTKSVGCTVKRF